MHNTSAVMRSCEVVLNSRVNRKQRQSIDKEIAMGAQKWVDINI
jgi:tRNA (guanosine-2'-O-)-methyltransferase